MNRDFEFKQLLRAYRTGIISESTFEREMAELEHGASGATNGSGFRAMGKTYGSEREAIISFLDNARAAESNAGVAFSNWAKVCKTDCIGSGLRMIAERESYHGRVFEQRLRELGAECRAVVTEQSRKFSECVSDPNLSDNEKLLRVNALIKDPIEVTKPIREFAEAIKDDLNTKELVKLFCEDELSSTKWLCYACAALNAPAQASASASQPSMSA
jgi:rubrerythrin